MIIVAGHLRVAAADREAYLATSAEAVRLAREAPGCLDFVVAADLLDPERVNVSERWTDRASLAAFRGAGPGGELGAMIVAADVREYEASPLA
jgi:quinol monooxygenase YgiN